MPPKAKAAAPARSGKASNAEARLGRSSAEKRTVSSAKRGQSLSACERRRRFFRWRCSRWKRGTFFHNRQ